jgi:hypothetical protein
MRWWLPTAAKPRRAIVITLPDGSSRDGTAWETTPMDIAMGISKGLANKAVVAKVWLQCPSLSASVLAQACSTPCAVRLYALRRTHRRSVTPRATTTAARW